LQNLDNIYSFTIWSRRSNQIFY